MPDKAVMRTKVVFLCIIAVVVGGYCFTTFHSKRTLTLHATPAETLKEATFQRLERIRVDKAEDIRDLLSNFQKMANSVGKDDLMTSFFSQLLSNLETTSYEYEIDKRYVQKYGDFYDILFVDRTGTVRHSIKKESDFNKNLFATPFSSTLLGRKLQSTPAREFIEFEFYNPSSESAAFFVVPFKRNKNLSGWFVFQLASNSLNAALSDRKALGRTGEVYLVNNKNKMLSDSRFFKSSTILTQDVTTEAVELSRKNGQGEKIIEDYRHTPVFSSFQQVEVFGTEWTLIVEIDEEEIITEYYKEHHEAVLAEMLRQSFSQQETFFKQLPIGLRHTKIMKKVDMNEYNSSTGKDVLATYGVATCTAVAAVLPNKTAYLAHLSPTDEIYVNAAQSFLLGRKHFHLLEEMLGTIRYYDVYPSELKEMKVYIVIPNSDRIHQTIEAFLDQGLDLNNIFLVYHPTAQSANVQVITEKQTVEIEWNFVDHSVYLSSINVIDLSNILKGVIGYRG